MKHRKIRGIKVWSLALVILATALSVIFVTGCANTNNSTNKKDDSSAGTTAGSSSQEHKIEGAELVVSYEGDVPAFVQKSGDNWFVIYQSYGNEEYKLAAGDSPDTGQTKYVGGGGIMNLSVNDGIAAWGARNDGKVRVNYYDENSDDRKTVETLFEEEGEYQQGKVYTLGGKVFYQKMDYSKNTFQIIAYDVATKEYEVLAEEAFTIFGGCFSLCDGSLVYQGVSASGDAQLVILDPDTGVSERVELPSEVLVLYDADVKGDDIALYYYDQSEGDNAWNQNDNIGIFKKGDTEFIPVFSFPKVEGGATYYAYKDNIEIHGDHVLWIYQQNVSGEIADHYHLTLYNHKTDEPIHETATFSFSTEGEDLYWLSFVDGDTKKVALFKAGE